MRVFIYCNEPGDLADKIDALLVGPEEQVIRIPILGGPIAFAFEALKEVYFVMLWQIRHYMKKFPVDEIVLVGHNHDCEVYSEIRRPKNKKADLIVAAENAARHLRNVRVTAVFEETVDGETEFSSVFCSEAINLVASAR